MSTETQNNIDIVVLFPVHIHQHGEYISKQRQPLLVCEYPYIYQFSIKSQVHSQFTLIYRLKHNGLSYNGYIYKLNLRMNNSAISYQGQAEMSGNC